MHRLVNLLHAKEIDHDAMPSFVRSVEDRDGVRIFHLQGDLGVESSPEMQAGLERARDRRLFARDLVVDFEHVTHVDTSTIAFLVQSLQNRLDTGAALALVNLPDELVSRMEISKVRDLFTAFPDIDAAVDALRA